MEFETSHSLVRWDESAFGFWFLDGSTCDKIKNREMIAFKG